MIGKRYQMHEKRFNHIRLAAIISASGLLAVFCGYSVSADTVFMKSEQAHRGVVVEEYKDRIIFATIDGEMTLMKSDILEIEFDGEETNLIKLAEQALDRRNYTKAAGYYSSALKVNPNSGEAKIGLIQLRLHLYDKEKMAKEADIERMNDLNLHGSSINSVGSDSEERDKSSERVKRLLGLVFGASEGVHIVKSVTADSPAFNAGIRKYDILVAIWGRLTGYMSTYEVIDRLLKEASSEIRCTIERTTHVAINHKWSLFSRPEDLIGATLAMEFDGLTVSKVMEGGPASNAGLADLDQIVAIDFNSTRYMPLKEAVGRIRYAAEGVSITFRRNVVIWKR